MVKEHANLPFPEGSACAKVLLTAEDGNAGGDKIIKALGLGFIYKFLTGAFHIMPDEFYVDLPKLKGSGFGFGFMPALLGVGYIVGRKISSLLMAGSLLGWLIIMPCLYMFGSDDLVFPSNKPISSLAPWELWSSCIRYIGAGALVTAGLFHLFKTFPVLAASFSRSLLSDSSKHSLTEPKEIFL